MVSDGESFSVEARWWWGGCWEADLSVFHTVGVLDPGTAFGPL